MILIRNVLREMPHHLNPTHVIVRVIIPINGIPLLTNVKYALVVQLIQEQLIQELQMELMVQLPPPMDL